MQSPMRAYPPKANGYRTKTMRGVTIELEDHENEVSDACLYPKGQRPI
jgi:hypothetical protein